MNKILDDLWRIIVYSLVSLFVVVNLLQYLNNHDWWKIEEIKGEDESPHGSSVFWFLGGVTENNDLDQPKTELFVKNIRQETVSGSSGFFRRIFPGQYFFLRVSYAGKTAYSPVFILKNGEIRRLNFHFSPDEETLSYDGTTVRRIKIKKQAKIDPLDRWISELSKVVLPNGFLQNLK